MRQSRSRRLALLSLTVPLSLFVLIFLPASAFARAGGGEGYHGGGGGGSGGGGGGGGGGGALLFDLIYLCLVHPVIGIPVLIIVIVFFYYSSQKGAGAYQSSVIRRGSVAIDEHRNNQVLTAIQARDPQFNPAEFTARVGSAFMKIQDAWCKQDLSSVRPFISDGVHERFTLQFAEQKAEGYRDQMDQIAIDDINIIDLASDAIYDEVSVRIEARAADRHVSISDGRSTAQTSAQEPFVEVWSFLRRQGVVTTAGKPGLIEGNCPNCGAPVEMNQASNCSRCGALLRSGEYDWVLTEITQQYEWQAASGRSVPGLEKLREADPELNVQSLEDRTSVIFWRKVAAERLGKIDPLRKVIAAERVDAFAADLRLGPGGRRIFFGQCAVGAVQVLGFPPVDASSARQRALIGVRWGGRPYSVDGSSKVAPAGTDSLFNTLFILARAAGAKTEVAKGISSAHCPNCGAPESGGTTGACEFCGTALNDGQHGWVLEQTLSRSDPKADALMASLRSVDDSNGPIPLAGMPRAGAGISGDGPRVAPGSLGLLAWAVKVAYADGNLDESERRMLVQFAAARNVPQQRLDYLLRAAQAGAMESPEPDNPAQAREWLAAMAATAGADGKFDQSEFAVLRALGDKVGLSDSDVRDLINRTRSERYAQAKDALRTAKNQPPPG